MTNEEREKAIEVFENANKCLEQRKKFKCDYNCDKCTASKAYSQKELEKPVNTALEALKQEPCEDAVSRKAVLELAKEECDTAIIPYKRFVKDINALPPVTPIREHGEWTDEVIEKQGNKLIECMTTEACKIARGNIDMARKILAGKISEEEKKQLIFGADARKEQ